MSFWAGIAKGVEANDKERQINETRDERKAEREEAQAWRESQFEYQKSRDSIIDARNAAATETAAEALAYTRERHRVQDDLALQTFELTKRTARAKERKERYEIMTKLGIFNPEALGTGTFDALAGSSSAGPTGAPKPISTQTGVEVIQSMTNQLDSSMPEGKGYIESLEVGSDEHTFWTTIMKDPNAVAAIEAFRIAQNKEGTGNFIEVTDLPNIIKITNIVEAKGVDARKDFIDLVRQGGSDIQDEDAFWEGALAASQFRPLKVHWVQGQSISTPTTQKANLTLFENTLVATIARLRIKMEDSTHPGRDNKLVNIMAMIENKRPQGLQMAAQYMVLDPVTGETITLAEKAMKDLGLSTKSTPSLIAYMDVPNTGQTSTTAAVDSQSTVVTNASNETNVVVKEPPEQTKPSKLMVNGFDAEGNRISKEELVAAIKQIPNYQTYPYIDIGDGKTLKNYFFEVDDSFQAVAPVVSSTAGTADTTVTTGTGGSNGEVDPFRSSGAFGTTPMDGRGEGFGIGGAESMALDNPDLTADVTNALQGISDNKGENSNSIQVIEALIEKYGEANVEGKMAEVLEQRGLTLEDLRDHIHSSLVTPATGNTIPSPADPRFSKERFPSDPAFTEGRNEGSSLSAIADNVDNRMANVDQAKRTYPEEEPFFEETPLQTNIMEDRAAAAEVSKSIAPFEVLQQFNEALAGSQDLLSTVVEAAKGILAGNSSKEELVSVVEGAGFTALADSIETSEFTDKQVAEAMLRDMQVAGDLAQPAHGFQQQSDTGMAPPKAATGYTVTPEPLPSDPSFVKGRTEGSLNDIVNNIDSRMANVDGNSAEIGKRLTEMGETKVAQALSSVVGFSEEVVDVAVETLEDIVEGVEGNGKAVMAAVLRDQGFGNLATAFEQSGLTDEQMAQTLIISARRDSQPAETPTDSNIMSDREGLGTQAKNMFGGND